MTLLDKRDAKLFVLQTDQTRVLVLVTNHSWAVFARCILIIFSAVLEQKRTDSLYLNLKLDGFGFVDEATKGTLYRDLMSVVRPPSASAAAAKLSGIYPVFPLRAAFFFLFCVFNQLRCMPVYRGHLLCFQMWFRSSTSTSKATLWLSFFSSFFR